MKRVEERESKREDTKMASLCKFSSYQDSRNEGLKEYIDCRIEIVEFTDRCADECGRIQVAGAIYGINGTHCETEKSAWILPSIEDATWSS
jgi:hypothetical protein